MADVIQLLPDSIANQIAAGEVVQRPASAAKELLENAIDSGASRIQLIVKEAGKMLIQIIDNGCGMSETDARMCFERHATSKIRKAEDLFSIKTMGFRGEALASIAAVAQVELRTRRAIDELGIKIIIEASEVISQEVEQCPQGTSILVKNLFYNIPARRNFLKSNPIEMKHIIEDFQRVALANPDVHFSLHHNDYELFHLPAGNLKQRIVGIFGGNYNKNLVPVDEETGTVVLTGYIGKPEFAKKTRGEQLFFVNKRFVKSTYLQHAVMTAYEDLLPRDTFPLFVIFLEIDPARIDVNVHPTKTEIKFDDERLIYNYLKVAVRHSLGHYSVTPTLDFEQERGLPVANSAFTRQDTYIETIQSDFSKKDAKLNRGASINYSKPDKLQSSNLRNWEKLFDGLENDKWSENVDEKASATASQESFTIGSSFNTGILDDQANSFSKGHKEPYQIHNRYIVSQIKSGFLLIDQQAAHERILYERYLQLFDESNVSTQAELFPKSIELSVGDSEILKEILPEINRLGFDINEFGQNTFVIHGLPAELKQGSSEQQVIERLIEQYKMNINLSLELKEKIARAMSRSAAAKKGKSLDVHEMRTLIDQLFACEIPFHSPTGVKCFITYDLSDLEKLF
ncbi:MAG: DNA mismatch repair endonuclease MutL [Saprospiraceae bacterium]